MNALTIIKPARPVVALVDGLARADSRDVAAYFAKTHRSVLQAIDTAIAAEPDLALHDLMQGYYTLPETGAQKHRRFLLTRDGFSLIAMGFIGAKALKWKRAYIAAFNAMEAELRARKPAVDLNDPTSLRTLLLGYTEKVLALEAQVEEQAQGLAVAHEVIEQTAPKAEAYDHLMNDKGTCCLADAARIIGAPQGRFFQWLRDREFVFDKGEDTLPNAKLRKKGYFRVKIVRVSRDRYRDQTRVTRTGLDFLRLRWSVGPAKEIEAEAFAARRQGVLGL